MREGPFDLEAGARRVLGLAAATDGCTPERLVAVLAQLLADLDPRRRSCLLEPPPDTLWRLAYAPLGLRFDLPPAEVEWAFWSAAIPWTPEPGVSAALDALAGTGLPCAVLSNAMFRSQTVERQLATAGLLAPFRLVMTSADYVYRKPHHRLFELAALHLGQDPTTLWFIGDSMECDVRGAAAAGMIPIWYHPGPAPEQPVAPAAHVLSRWAQLPDLLASVLRA
jgi:putative hydrolase of the HAD superfamily